MSVFINDIFNLVDVYLARDLLDYFIDGNQFDLFIVFIFVIG